MQFKHVHGIKSINPSFIKDKSQPLKNSVCRQAQRTTQEWWREVITIEDNSKPGQLAPCRTLQHLIVIFLNTLHFLLLQFQDH